MPQVPTYGNPQVREQVLQGGFQQNIDVSSSTRALGQGLLQVAEVADRVVMREAERDAYNTQTAIQSQYLDYQQKYQKERTNDKAKNLLNDVDQWWSQAAVNAAKGLNPLSQSIVTKALKQASLQARASAGQFENQQLDNATDIAWNAAKATGISSAAAAPFVQVPGTDANGVPTMVNAIDASLADLRAKNAEYAARKGLTDPKILEALNLKDSTLLHTQVLQGLERSDPDAARAYFDKYTKLKQIDGTVQAEISQRIDTVGNQAKAQTMGAQLAQQFNYTQTSAAQKAIDAMPGSPELKKAVRAEVEHRHAVQQSDADKAQAVTVSRTMEMLYSGKSPAAILASPEYQSLRDKGTVLKAIQDKSYSDMLRANAADTRSLQQLELHERRMNIEQSAQAFAYSDPTVLNAMPREQIAALLPVLGRTWTGQLLAKKDSFAKSEDKLREAKIDQDDFNLVADKMGLSPFSAKSESAKRDLVTVKARTEQLIDAWQIKNGREMPREEKRKLMSTELATEITLKRAILPDTTTNPLQISDAELKNVKVPDVDRGQIIVRMREITGNPNYMPTPEEFGAAYVQKRRQETARGAPAQISTAPVAAPRAAAVAPAAAAPAFAPAAAANPIAAAAAAKPAAPAPAPRAPAAAARPAAAAALPAFTREEALTFNSLTSEILPSGDVVVTRGNKRVMIGNVGGGNNMTAAQDLIFEWIRENKIGSKDK